MTVDSLKTIFDWTAILLLLLTFVFALGILVTGNIINSRQAVKLRQFDKDLTDAKIALASQQERTAVAEAKVAGLEKDAADAKAEMAKQQTRAAAAERSLLELQDRVKLRHLSSDQRKKLIAFLSTAQATKGPLRVQRLIFDETAEPFAVEIKEAFDAAGWTSADVGKTMIPTGGKIPVGIVLIIRDAKNMPPHLGVVQRAFAAAALESSLGENPSTPGGMIEILIGVKP